MTINTEATHTTAMPAAAAAEWRLVFTASATSLVLQSSTNNCMNIKNIFHTHGPLIKKNNMTVENIK